MKKKCSPAKSKAMKSGMKGKMPMSMPKSKKGKY